MTVAKVRARITSSLGSILFFFLVQALLISGVSAQAPAESRPSRRLALVMGNDDYQHVERLQKAVADGRAMGIMLRELGYQTFEGFNLTRRGTNQLIEQFEAQLAPGTTAVVFFAGHGVEIGGRGVLLPVDAEAATERQVIDSGILVTDLFTRVTARNPDDQRGLNFFILDACRNNPIPQRGRAISGPAGLSPLSVGSASGLIILYSAGVGEQALDRLSERDTNPNGLFTRVFLQEARQPGLSVVTLADRVREGVATIAQGVSHRQTPAIYIQARGSFAFGRGSDAPPAAPPAPSPPPSPAALPGPSSEQGAIDFVMRLHSSFGNDNQTTMNFLRQRYAPQVEFYGGAQTSAQILRAKEEFFARWPQRVYTVRSASLQVSCEPATATCSVSGVVDWDARSAARSARSIGAANFRYTLRMQGQGRDPLIIGETGQVISRQPSP